MKNLTVSIPVNKNNAKELLAKSDLAGYGIKVSRGEVPIVNGEHIFQPGFVRIKFEIPADKVTDIANIEGETSEIMGHLRLAARYF